MRHCFQKSKPDLIFTIGTPVDPSVGGYRGAGSFRIFLPHGRQASCAVMIFTLFFNFIPCEVLAVEKRSREIPKLTAVPLPALKSSPAKCIAEDCYDWSVKIGEETIPLRGAGLFTFLRVEVYTAAFYVPERAKKPEEVLGNIPRCLEIRYHHEIKAADILKVADKNLRGNPTVDYKKIQRRLEKVNSFYHDIKPGDVYKMTYIPGKGTVFEFNGKQEITAPGEDFASAYFGIWLSRYSINQKFRKILLGLK